jgi:AraC family transcriptional regulator of adaptative response/methylated-DNA-[protein]-cysteine methyltransferase
MEIGYTIVKGRLGRLLVAATARGICMVSLGDSAAQLAANLRREYPNATIHREASGVVPWAKTILKYLRGNQSRLNLPLDVEATAFQRRVWEELRRIPYGITRSYKQIAQAIGRPKAVRAVARACATNPVSLVIPCHRVLRSDGSLGGYRWGLGRKRALLETESRQCPRPASAAAHRSFFPETRVK